MFKHIFIAVDGTEAAQEALDHAVTLARQSRAALTGLFVIDTQWADFIGNDWQSSRNARQGFLDYMRDEQERQSRKAREQFESAVRDLPVASFAVLAGDPADALMERMTGADGKLLVLSRRVFQASGRPSLKTLAKRLAEKCASPILLFP